jgi:putative N6-adenine-specific DNA methylase
LSYRYQETPRYFVQIAGGLEALGMDEAKALGATDTEPAYRGFYATFSPEALYGFVYQTRLASRVLAPLTGFGCHNPDYLYRTAQQIDWSDFLSPGETFAVFATVSNSKIRHSKYAALRLKDAVVDQFRERTGQRPSVDTRLPDVWLNLHIENNFATISLDAAGGALHRRGYRVRTGPAPMQETVAAAALAFSEWDGERRFYDPFCGTGTLLAEALMRATRTPSAYLRAKQRGGPGFGFSHLPDFDAALWQRIQAEADGAIRAVEPGLIAGSDADQRAVDAALANLAELPHGDAVRVERRDAFALEGFENATLVTNPPYGIRMAGGDDAFFKRLGDFLKQRCTGSTAYVYVGQPELLKRVGLRTSWKKPLVSGAHEGRLARYDLY